MGEAFADVLIARLERLVLERGDPSLAPGMAQYMRGQFPFAGIKSAGVTTILREALDGLPKPTSDEALGVAERLWQLREREYQYLAVAFLARNARRLEGAHLERVRALITSKSWWDTVDALAANVVGPIVLANRELVPTMDRWIDDADIWVARTALLHQLKYKSQTDEGRLFAYCTRRAADREFFIRKAIGWALREYSKTAPDAVRAFVAAHEAELSGLSRREGMLWLTGRPGSRRRAEVEAATSPGRSS